MHSDAHLSGFHMEPEPKNLSFFLGGGIARSPMFNYATIFPSKGNLRLLVGNNAKAIFQLPPFWSWWDKPMSGLSQKDPLRVVVCLQVLQKKIYLTESQLIVSQ